MFTGDDILCEYARKNVLFNADSVWISEDEAFSRSNLEEWVRWKIVQSLKRSKLLDCFAILWSKLSKRVQHIIPFSNVDELRYYEFDVSVSSLAISTSGSEFKESQRLTGGNKVEPWMLAEVERIFKLLNGGRTSRYDAAGYKLAERGYFAHGICGKFCPFFQIKLMLFRLFGTFRKRKKGAVNDGLPDLELDVLTKEKDFDVLKQSVKCPCDAQDVLPQEILHHYRRLLSRVKLSDVFLGDHDQEMKINPEGSYLFPIYAENLSFSQASFQFMDRDEYTLYRKTFSENIRNIWKRVIPGVDNMNMGTVFKHILKNSKVPSERESQFTQAEARQMGSCNYVFPTRVNCHPSKPPGLNVEVPEFYPRKDDISLNQDVSQLYFPSGSFADFSKSLFPYIGTAWEDEKISVCPNPSNNVDTFSNFGQISTPQRINPANCGIQSDFRGHSSQKYQPTNFHNQQQQQPNVLQQHQIFQPQQQPNSQHSNYLIPMVQKPQSQLFPGADQPAVSGCQNLTSGTSIEQQIWIANFLRIYYQQQWKNQVLSQVDRSVHSSQQTSGLQYRAPDVGVQFPQRSQYERNLPQSNPIGEDTIAIVNVAKSKVDEKEDQPVSPPKNIPVYQRPPESYNFTQNDNNCRRRNGGGGGGGGAVLANLIVLTKGGGRWKTPRNQIPDHGVKEKVTKANHSNKLEISGIPPNHNSSDKTANLNEGSRLKDISQGLERLSSVTSQKIPINESRCNEDISKEISTIVFESSSASSAINDTTLINPTIAPPENKIDLKETDKHKAGECRSKESDRSHDKLTKDDVKGIAKAMTSTPIKEEEGKVENVDSLKWLDVTITDEDTRVDEEKTTKSKEIEEDIVRDTLTDAGPKLVQASKSLENSCAQWSDVKGTMSDPSFPPIRSKTSRGSHLKPSNTSWTPTVNVSSQRRLYSDVLLTPAGIVSSNCKDLPVSDASSSMDSLEKRFKELEMMAVEQYQSQSSDDSVTRIYNDLEMQAVEQYRTSCEGETKIVQERRLASVKEDSTEFEEDYKHSDSCSLNDLKVKPSTSGADQNKDNESALKVPKQTAVLTLHEVNSTESFNATISSTSLASEMVTEGADIGKTLILNPNNERLETAVKSETELLTKQGNHSGKVSSQVSCPNISSQRLENKRSKTCLKPMKSRNQGQAPGRGTTNKRETDRGGTESLASRETPLNPSRHQIPQISRLANGEGSSTNSLCSAQNEAPNEQRTQVSTMAGTKSEDKKEDPTQEKSTGVPETWVPNLVHVKTSDQRGENAEKAPSSCFKNKNQIKNRTESEKNKSERPKKKDLIDQGLEAEETTALPAKSKKNGKNSLGGIGSAKKKSEPPVKGTLDQRFEVVEVLALPASSKENLGNQGTRSGSSVDQKSGRNKKKDTKGQTEVGVPPTKSKGKSSVVLNDSTEKKSERTKKKAVSVLPEVGVVEALLLPTKSKESLPRAKLGVSAEKKMERTKKKIAVVEREETADVFLPPVKSSESFKISVAGREVAGKKNDLSKKESVEQGLVTVEALSQPSKSSEIVEASVVGNGSVEKDGLIDDESKKGAGKKRRRGKRKKNKKTTLSEADADVQTIMPAEDHCKVTSDSGNEDMDIYCMIESKVAEFDCTSIMDVIPNGEINVLSQSIPISCSLCLPHDVLSEKSFIANRAFGDTDFSIHECSLEVEGTQNKKKGSSRRRRRRNRKTQAVKDLEDIVLENISRELFLEEDPMLKCLRDLNNGKKPTRNCQSLCQENHRRSFVKTLDHCNDLSMQPKNSNPVYPLNTQLTRQNSDIDFEFSVSPPETIDDLNGGYGDILGFEGITFNLGCSAGVGEMAGLISRRMQKKKKSKLQKKLFAQDNLGCEIFESTNPLEGHEVNGRGSENALRIARGIGCSNTAALEEDINEQLLIPILYEDAVTEDNLECEFADINIEKSTFRSVNILGDEDNIYSYFDYKEHFDVPNDFGEHSPLSSLPMDSNLEISAHSGVIDATPISSSQCLHSQISAQSLSRISNESTPRTPRSASSNKSTSSYTSVLSKLMRSGRKTRKPKAAGPSGVCGRSTPTCALQ